jgi:formyltetrahydrofolate-dependent phosphoribosylglycinamide formyltransferase
LANVPARVVLLASGSGTTLQAVLDASAAPAFGALVVAAGTDVPGCPAMSRAADAGVATFAVAPADYDDRAAWNEALAAAIAGYRPDLVVLAGFMRILAAPVVRRFRIINTHPSLLPAFPGGHALRDALAAGVTGTGVTVHWVDEGVDTGPIIAQERVPIAPGDDEDALRARVQAAEKPLYVRVISELCSHLSSQLSPQLSSSLSPQPSAQPSPQPSAQPSPQPSKEML